MRKYRILERTEALPDSMNRLKYVIQIFRPGSFGFIAKWVDISAEYSYLEHAEESLNRLRELKKTKSAEITERIIKEIQF